MANKIIIFIWVIITIALIGISETPQFESYFGEFISFDFEKCSEIDSQYMDNFLRAMCEQNNNMQMLNNVGSLAMFAAFSGVVCLLIILLFANVSKGDGQ